MRSPFAVAAGLVLGLVFGLVASASGTPALVRAAGAIEPLGTLFVNLVRMVVVPLVATTVFSGIARLGDARAIGRLGVRTLAFFWSTTLVAIVTGMAIMRLALPLAPTTIAATGGADAVQKLPTTAEFLVSLVPVNPIAAAANGQLLPLIVFMACVGAAASTLAPPVRQRLLDVADGVSDAMVGVVHWVLWLAPMGVFALAAAVTAKAGWAMLQTLAVFVGAVLVGLIVFYAIMYLPAVHFLSRVAVPRFVRACVRPVALAFSTTSSAASLPALFEAAAQLELSPAVSGFVLSLGAAINRAGSALFQGAAIVFLSSVYGVHLSSAAVLSALLATFVLSQTVAGVPSAGVVTLAPVLASLGIPLSSLGLLLGVDRIPDMARTATQVTGHLAAACVVDRLEAAART